MNTFCLVTNWSKSRIELKGIFQEVALEPVEWFVVFGDWGGGVSRVGCLSVVFAQVKSVFSAKLFHFSAVYGLETCLILLNSEYSCVSICCFARGHVFLPLVGIVLGYRVVLVQEEKAVYPPPKKPLGVTQSERLR